MQLTLVARSGVHPKRWEMALQILLAKHKGKYSVENCRYLIIYEADFNQYKNYFIGGTANETMNRYEGLPDDIYSRKGGTSPDCKFDSTLMTDIARQSRILMALVSIDASQCYDRVLHLVLWMTWYALTKFRNVCITIVSCL